MQSRSFVIDNDIKDFYLAHKVKIPEVLNSTELKVMKMRFTVLRQTIFSLFQEKAKLVKEKVPDLSVIKNKISRLITEKKDIMSKLDQHKLLLRLLNTLEGLQPNSPLFFSFEFDFRMRLYCNPFEFSFMGSKFVRSFLRFQDSHPFDEAQFGLYSVLQYSASRDLSEVQISALFTAEVRSILTNFPHNLKAIFSETREPFMFIACCFEWQRKLKCKGQFLSNFPIYLDCSANGPQLIALFFALRDFGEFLNLVPQKVTDVRADFYTTLISKFIVQQQTEKWIYLKQKIDMSQLTKFCNSVMRPLLKNNIMTRFYGVSFLKFSTTIRDSFKKKQEDLELFFNVSESNFTDFTSAFASKFWKFTTDVPLFQLEELLHMVQKLSMNKRSIDWSVFNVNIIQMYYTNVERYRYNSNAGQSRTQFVLYRPNETSVSPKQRSAFMANFVHSLDAYVLYRTCAELDFPVIPIHDSFGVHGFHVVLLRSKIRELFAFLVDGQAASKFFISQLADLLSESSSPEIKEDFLKFVNKKLNFGTLSKNDVMASYYYIYYN
jgi:DNA-directed RNA polymerase